MSEGRANFSHTAAKRDLHQCHAMAVFVCMALPHHAWGGDGYPATQWETANPSEVGMKAEPLQAARDYALSGGGSGVVIRCGKLVMSWGNQDRLYDLKSTTKSIGVSALGLAIADKKVRLDDPAGKYHPSFAVPPDANRGTHWIGRIKLQHLATHTAGFAKPGGYSKLAFEPGAKWSYSDGGPNWLAECLTLAYQRDIDELLFHRIFAPVGIQRTDLVWRKNAYRDATINGIPRREFGSGISADVDAMARFGYLYLRGGQWKGRQLLPREFVQAVGRPVDSVVGLPESNAPDYGNASDHYGLLWWNNADQTLVNVPRDAYWSWGLYESLIVVIPSLDLVVARAGKSWQRKWGGHYDVLRPFLEPIVNSTHGSEKGNSEEDSKASRHDNTPPYPPSAVIRGVQWAPASSIVRRARGSDNWPITWGDDGHLYTAYGDGHGFEPFIEKKLSMGLARVEGNADDFRGINLRSTSAERTGGGAAGPKVSGMLMVDGKLYMLVRNRGNSQLAWSSDRGQTWTWCPWKFDISFGCPTFLNYGQNYANARDDNVYIYSFDSKSAYQRSDRMVLARVAKAQLLNKNAYEFFRQLAADGFPVWTRDINERGAVFSHKGCCYRSSITYHAALGRYLWCQTGSGDDTRFRGGLGIYDAPEPWGPWTTVFFTREWDVGPGETSSLPSKWTSPDGRTIHLVFSGDDCFSVRRGVLQVTD